ncbi:MAG: hypothetical protein DHS20C14_08590 [Phycisphaeraceae bacterium]|nr:MAG: hypothetical protein DHS20C14_08590 [Phycisphaeraceae bacterium]
MIERIAAAVLHASAGVGAPGTEATIETPPRAMETAAGARRLTGHLYVNAGTGEAVFTPAKEYLANRAGRSFRALGDDITGDGIGDLWVNTNLDPCPIGTPANPHIELGILDGAVAIGGSPDFHIGDHHLYKLQTGAYLGAYSTDLRINHISFTYWTDLLDTDTDSDTVPDGNTAGAGIELSFWDREDQFGKTDCFCPQGGGPGFTREHITTLRFENLPGALVPPVPGYLVGYVITLELDQDQVFEIADSDGVGPASGLYNPMIAALDIDTNGDTLPDATSADTDGNGQIDFAVSLRGIQPTDGRVATIAYTLAAPGVPGVPNTGTDDGVIDYANRTDGTPPLQSHHTRILLSSIIPPMGRSGLPFTSALLPVPSAIDRFSIFFASLGEQPDPDGAPPTFPVGCAGLPSGDHFAWGSVHPPDGNFYGGFNCEIDDDGDTLPDGRPWSAPFLALSSSQACTRCTFADCDCNVALNVDDIDCFIVAFLGGDLRNADCDGNGTLNIDDVDCFVVAYMFGCPR